MGQSHDSGAESPTVFSETTASNLCSTCAALRMQYGGTRSHLATDHTCMSGPVKQYLEGPPLLQWWGSINGYSWMDANARAQFSSYCEGISKLVPKWYWGFPVLFPQLQGKCQGKTRKDGARPALFLIFVLLYVFLCYFVYCLFCVFLCIVCVYMCTELLPPGGYPIAVKYIISYIISYHIISYHIIELKIWLFILCLLWLKNCVEKPKQCPICVPE